MEYRVVPADPGRWADVLAVMGERGDPSRCLCQYFRLRGKAWESATTASNRAALEQQVCHGERPPGVLAYDDSGTPVGWCAVAPRTEYPRVVASPNWRTGQPSSWVITCFVVPPPYRRQGVTTALIAGAVELAEAGGADRIEGCAVDVAATGRITSADLYRGPLTVFLAAGFHEISRTSPRWVLVRRPAGRSGTSERSAATPR